jgi:RNA recognition motif-containing protein
MRRSGRDAVIRLRLAAVPAAAVAAREDSALGKKLYVGNLPYSTNDADLRSLFERHGRVESATVISDRETGRSRGFGFVEMDPDAADAARQSLDGQDFGGRKLRVSEANERRGPGGGPGGPRGGGPRGGGGFRDRDRDRDRY